LSFNIDRLGGVSVCLVGPEPAIYLNGKREMM